MAMVSAVALRGSSTLVIGAVLEIGLVTTVPVRFLRVTPPAAGNNAASSARSLSTGSMSVSPESPHHSVSLATGLPNPCMSSTRSWLGEATESAESGSCAVVRGDLGLLVSKRFTSDVSVDCGARERISHREAPVRNSCSCKVYGNERRSARTDDAKGCAPRAVSRLRVGVRSHTMHQVALGPRPQLAQARDHRRWPLAAPTCAASITGAGRWPSSRLVLRVLAFFVCGAAFTRQVALTRRVSCVARRASCVARWGFLFLKRRKDEKAFTRARTSAQISLSTTQRLENTKLKTRARRRSIVKRLASAALSKRVADDLEHQDKQGNASCLYVAKYFGALHVGVVLACRAGRRVVFRRALIHLFRARAFDSQRGFFVLFCSHTAARFFLTRRNQKRSARGGDRGALCGSVADALASRARLAEL